MNLTDEQIRNWRKAFPFLQLVTDTFIQQVAAIVQMRMEFSGGPDTKKEVVKRINSNLFQLIRVGTKFYENGFVKYISRVTDMVFDSVDAETKQVQVRNLDVLKSVAMRNSISIINF